MSGYRVTHGSAAGRFAEGEPGPEGIHQARLLVRTLLGSSSSTHSVPTG